MEYCKILLIDDDSDWINSYKTLFPTNIEYSFQFDEAFDFHKATKLINSNKYDLAIVDFLLDHNDHAKARLYWRLLHRDLKLYNIPIIVASTTDEHLKYDDLISMINYFKIDAVIDKNRLENFDNSFIKSILNFKKLSYNFDREINIVELSKILDEKFDLSDLNKIMFNLNIDSENIAGSTKREKIINLIKYCERYNLLAELLKTAKSVNTAAFNT